MIEKLHPVVEDPEFATMSDSYMNALVSGQMPCHQDWDRILRDQGIELHPVKY